LGSNVTYDGSEHGDIQDFLEEGEEVFAIKPLPDGRRAIHRHFPTEGSWGPYEYAYE
jgi:hypothetical protein